MLRFITLYAVLVLVSATIIALSLKTNPLPALATASVGAIFKTIAAHLHGKAWDWIKPPVRADPAKCGCR